MKKLIILKHGGGELVNQLWNYVAIYAYGLHAKVKVENPSFFEYHNFFNFLEQESLQTRIISFFFKKLRRRAHPINHFFRTLYLVLAKIKLTLNKTCTLSSENTESQTHPLPPTKEIGTNAKCEKLYFIGWLFRNPEGLKKYRSELVEAFSPIPKIRSKVEKTISDFRKKYEVLIGVHVRQADYKVFKGGTYFVEQKRIRQIIDEYIDKNNINKNTTLFIFTSDGPIEKGLFSGLNIHISKEDAVTDLFMLSETDTILGSDSSFGAFASWYGNIPHIIFKKGPIDWSYYEDKKGFFENKYLVLAPY